tara:strand:+ start:319 stop:2196 length:1878 start_codon:yes stop_codon:yes gene_type:complete
MPQAKNIQYLNKDFDTLKQKLIEFAEIYYPSTYNDFSEESAGMMLIEMASYVGDVLSFYTDNQVQENYIQFAKQRDNLLSLAYSMGYTPQVTNAATTDVEIFQTIPSTTIRGTVQPDWNYALIIEEGGQLQSANNTSVFFYIEDKIDFTVSGSSDPTDISVYSTNAANQPSFYLLKKKARAVSGNLQTTTFSFTTPQRFSTVEITDNNIIEIIKCTDSDNNRWYQVPYLAQETIFNSTSNIASNDPNLYQYNETTPYLLKIDKVPRRFVTRFKANNTLELQFGPGVSSNPDEEIIPNSDNIGLGLPYGVDKLTTAYDPSNFLYTKTYGLAPSNTTLTIEYLTGGGAESNVPAQSLTLASSINTTFFGNNLDATLSSTVQSSLAFNNLQPAIGGGDGDTNEDIRLNSLAQYPTQLRTVTKDDYMIRALSLPSKYGVIYKTYITQESDILNNNTTSFSDYNDNTLCLYILSKNNNGLLTLADPALKQNLKTYLAEYRMVTDAVGIKDAFIINLGINFDVIMLPNFNNRIVLNNCINALKVYFDTDKWQINQPILINNVKNILDTVEGVQTIKNLTIVNKSGSSSGYSEYAYDIEGATIDNVLYPSLDPSIFEVRFPDIDIQGRVVTN